MLNIAVLVSGGGTNLQALIDAQGREGLGGGRLALVLSSKEGVYALERAEKAGIPGEVLARGEFADQDAFDDALLAALERHEIGLVVLAGFMSIVSSRIVARYENRIINVHPALIPSFCGQGFYGLRVHQSALERGVKLSGATVHFVNNVCDGGPIIQQKAVEVFSNDTPETLQKRIMEQAEWKLLPQAAALFCQGKLRVENNIVHILEEAGGIAPGKGL